MTVYSAIKGIASSKGVSIYRIEHDLEFTNGLISKWNKSIPSAVKLQAVADYLGVTTTFILNKSKEEEVIK
ncbi:MULTISPECIES: helix-turn-helix domain-containing protein [Lentilactobacillus]|uniref:helix-turn-helix domain-containing protein n=1 Tax=Lentilactobacillus TaxID=2767893 RepID=UPI0021A874A8|nr:helix-turn-helix domain-containing protein [Lentilactobacillus buchneri]MCT2899685.1 XRE family transcriptional regulator [Lentilactobacillus buchneri]